MTNPRCLMLLIYLDCRGNNSSLYCRVLLYISTGAFLRPKSFICCDGECPTRYRLKKQRPEEGEYYPPDEEVAAKRFSSIGHFS